MNNRSAKTQTTTLRWPLLWMGVAGELVLLGLLNCFDDWTLETNPIFFVITAAASGAFYFFAIWRFSQIDLGRRHIAFFWIVSVLLRVAVLPVEPGDDLWRYQWEGRVQLAGFNPYVSAPDAPELKSERDEFENWYRINHRGFPAIYPAGAELLFKTLSAVSSAPLFYKIVFALADLATVALLIRLIGGTSRYGHAAWYAWNPLIVYSFAGAAHFDSLMLAPLVGGIWLIKESIEKREPREKWLVALAAAGALGVAISIKLIPVLLLLACTFALRTRAITLVLSAGIPLLLSLIYGFPQVPIFEPIGDFAYVTRLNDLFWWLVEDTVWPNPRQKNYSYNAVIAVAVVLVSLLWWRRWERGLLWSMGAALILSPALHPWYVTWILPLATWRQAIPWHALSISVFAYYLFFTERLFLLPWRSELWMRVLIIVPPLLALGLTLLKPSPPAAAASESSLPR